MTPSKAIWSLLVLDATLCGLLIAFEPTYVFDWDAYMEQVAQVRAGQYDYAKLHGDTGPLVYPAGFVWLFDGLSRISNWNYTLHTTEYIPKPQFAEKYPGRVVRPLGRMIALQALFALVYLLCIGLLARSYQRSKTMPWWGIFLLMCSRRVHGIFVLGLFNDCWAVLFLVVSLHFLLKDKWITGCIFFSLAVSIKMNILLFAPSLLLLMLQRFRSLRKAVELIAVCALVQISLALPFLLSNPFHYIAGAFNLGRQFTHEWSVNWQFLPSSVFLSKVWAVGLLVAHLGVLWMFAEKKWSAAEGGLRKLIYWSMRSERGGKKGALLAKNASASVTLNPNLPAEHVLTVMLTGNFIGILFCRSMHYQFFSWYFFSVPYLLFRTDLQNWARAAVFIAMEVAWNQHPPAAWSSILLQAAHLTLLVALWRHDLPPRQKVVAAD